MKDRTLTTKEIEMKLHLLVTLTFLSVALFSGQAVAAGQNNDLTSMEMTILSSTERGLSDTAMRAGTQDVRGYFGSPAEHDIQRTIQSSRENGLVTYSERVGDQDVRPYSSETGKALEADIWQTVESSKESGGRH
jgi:hypothetical protein